jgi:PAS domain S-box-containing protein
VQDHDGFWWCLTITPYRTLDHRIEGAVLTFADVNALKHSLQVAEDSRDYAEEIVEIIREPLIVLSADLRIERANKAFYRIFQLAPEDTEGRLVYELDNNQWDISPLRHLLEDIVHRNSFFEDFAVEHEFPRIGLRSMSLNARQIVHHDRDLNRILLAIEDVTERKLAEKRLMRSYADLEQFGYAVAHDLQALLRTFGAYAQLFVNRHKVELDSESDQILQSQMDGVTRMQNMVQDLLEYSRAGSPDAGSLEPVSAEAALKEALRNLQAEVEHSGASVTHGDLPTVACTSRQLIQVLQNLIGNSIKYRGEVPPRIHISAARRGREWVFSVRDNGIGFDEQYAQTIFGVFKRLEGHKYPGSGVGLAICQRVIERFGGSIWAESEQGVGSTFHFTIPVSEVDVHTRKQAHA